MIPSKLEEYLTNTGILYEEFSNSEGDFIFINNEIYIAQLERIKNILLKEPLFYRDNDIVFKLN